MIRYTNGMIQAFGVRAAMDYMITNEDATQCYYEAYSNGREQGLFVRGPHGAAAFAENRNSDSIVVYLAVSDEFPTQHFDMAGNVPDEKAYGDRQFFPPLHFREAARYILRGITGDESYGEWF